MNRVHRPHYTTQSLFWHASRRYQKRGAGLLSSLLQAEIEMDRCSSPDHRRLAADGLLTLSNEALWTGLTTTVAAESHLFGHHWPATSSPRMMEAGA